MNFVASLVQSGKGISRIIEEDRKGSYRFEHVVTLTGPKKVGEIEDVSLIPPLLDLTKTGVSKRTRP